MNQILCSQQIWCMDCWVVKKQKLQNHKCLVLATEQSCEAICPEMAHSQLKMLEFFYQN